MSSSSSHSHKFSFLNTFRRKSNWCSVWHIMGFYFFTGKVRTVLAFLINYFCCKVPRNSCILLSLLKKLWRVSFLVLMEKNCEDFFLANDQFFFFCRCCTYSCLFFFKKESLNWKENWLSWWLGVSSSSKWKVILALPVDKKK